MSRDWRGTLPGAEHTLGGLTCLPRGTLGGHTCLPRGTLGGHTCLPRGTLGGHTCLPRGTLGGLTCLPRGTLFGGYGPFVALVALVLGMALLAPTIAPERDVTTRPHPATAAPGSGAR